MWTALLLSAALQIPSLRAWARYSGLPSAVVPFVLLLAIPIYRWLLQRTLADRRESGAQGTPRNPARALAVRGESSDGIRPAMHPRGLRCSFLKYRPDILGRRALPTGRGPQRGSRAGVPGRLAGLGARRYFHHGLLVFTACAAIAIVAWIAYPIADQRRTVGLGSDADDSVAHVSARLIMLQDPYADLTYLDNTITQGMAWSLLWLPFATIGPTALAIPTWLLIFATVVARTAPLRWRSAAVAMSLAMTSPAVWEAVLTGSDFLVIGAATTLVVVMAHRFARRMPAAALVGIAAGVAGTSRLAFAGLPIVIAALLVRRSFSEGGRLGEGGRALAACAAATGVVITLGEPLFRHLVGWSHGPEQEVRDAAAMVGVTGLALIVAAWGVGVLALARLAPQTVAGWITGAVLVYAPGFAVLAAADFVRHEFHLAEWYGASYLVPFILPVIAVVVSTLHKVPGFQGS